MAFRGRRGGGAVVPRRTPSSIPGARADPAATGRPLRRRAPSGKEIPRPSRGQPARGRGGGQRSGPLPRARDASSLRRSASLPIDPMSHADPGRGARAALGRRALLGDTASREDAGARPRQPPPRRRRGRAEGRRARARAAGGRDDVDVAEDEAGGLRLMERMTGYDRAVLVDACVSGGSAGNDPAHRPGRAAHAAHRDRARHRPAPRARPSAARSACRCPRSCASSRSRPRASSSSAST